MQTNLTMVNGKWAVEVIGGPDEEMMVKTFEGREHATNWIRMVGTGQTEAPVLKQKKVEKEAAKPKKVKAVKP
jgi:hypothetical protein